MMVSSVAARTAAACRLSRCPSPACSPPPSNVAHDVPCDHQRRSLRKRSQSALTTPPVPRPLSLSRRCTTPSDYGVLRDCGDVELVAPARYSICRPCITPTRSIPRLRASKTLSTLSAARAALASASLVARVASIPPSRASAVALSARRLCLPRSPVPPTNTTRTAGDLRHGGGGGFLSAPSLPPRAQRPFSVYSHSYPLTCTPGRIPSTTYTATGVPSRLEKRSPPHTPPSSRPTCPAKYRPQCTTRVPARVPNLTRLPPACPVPAVPFTIVHVAFVLSPTPAFDRRSHLMRQRCREWAARSSRCPVLPRLDGARASKDTGVQECVSRRFPHRSLMDSTGSSPATSFLIPSDAADSPPNFDAFPYLPT